MFAVRASTATDRLCIYSTICVCVCVVARALADDATNYNGKSICSFVSSVFAVFS